MIIKGYIKKVCGETPTDLRMGVSAPETNFDRVNVTPTETQCKCAINDAGCQFAHDARKLGDWLEMQPQRFVMLGIDHDSYNADVWAAF
jgi:hypothetical protein